jgi:hypothetical protein
MEVYKACFLAFDVITMQINISFMTELSYWLQKNLNLADISSLASTSHLVLWDRPHYPACLANPDEAMFSSIDRGSTYGCIMLEQRFFWCLPLHNRGLYTSGFTIYWNGNGIVELEAQFKGASYSSGSLGVALHYPLCPSEQITHVWLRVNFRAELCIRNTIHQGQLFSLAICWCFLQIETTLGRLYLFGPYILPRPVMEGAYRCVLLKERGAIPGFYYETSPREIRRIDVCSDETSSILNPLKPRCLFHGGSIPAIGTPTSGLSVGHFARWARESRSVSCWKPLHRAVATLCRRSDSSLGSIAHVSWLKVLLFITDMS